MMRCRPTQSTICIQNLVKLKHLHNEETRFYCSQTFLYLDFQCRDDASEVNLTFGIEKSMSSQRLQARQSKPFAIKHVLQSSKTQSSSPKVRAHLMIVA